jgi:hypothetical protein
MKKLFLLALLIVLSLFASNVKAQSTSSIGQFGIGYTSAGELVFYVDYTVAENINADFFKVSGDFNKWKTYKDCKLVQYGDRNFFIYVVPGNKSSSAQEFCFNISSEQKDSEGNIVSYNTYFPEIGILTGMFKGDEPFLKLNPSKKGHDLYMTPDPNAIIPIK